MDYNEKLALKYIMYKKRVCNSYMFTEIIRCWKNMKMNKQKKSDSQTIENPVNEFIKIKGILENATSGIKLVSYDGKVTVTNVNTF